MVERQHRVRLSATEVGLELHHRVAALSREPLHRTDEELLQALGEIGTAEEFGRLLVLVCTFSQVHLPEVRSKLSLLVPAAGHIPVRIHHLAPRLEITRSLALDRSARD